MKIMCALLLAALTFGCGSYHAPAASTNQITTLLPASTAANGPQFTLTVNGSGFTSGSTVYFNTAAEATTFVSGIQLTATIPATAIMSSGAKSVYVLTTGGAYGSGQTSNTLTFTVN
jgi:hypothetical protein